MKQIAQFFADGWSHIDVTKLATWLHGLGAAAISALGLAGTDWIASLVDGQPINWHHMWVVLCTGAMGAAFLYLRQTPLPDFIIDGPAVVKVNPGQTAEVTTHATAVPPIDPTKPTGLAPRMD